MLKLPLKTPVKMSAVISTEPICCAICLDNIDISLNIIKTECNHCFHSNCFLQNAAHNGFNCPMCRNELASVPEEEESDYDEDEDEDIEINEDFVLRGARWLMMRAEGEEITENDTDDDTDDDDDSDDDDYEGFEYVRENTEESAVLSIAEITENITRRGITIDQLVALLVLPDRRHQEDREKYNYDLLKGLDNTFLRIAVDNAIA